MIDPLGPVRSQARDCARLCWLSPGEHGEGHSTGRDSAEEDKPNNQQCEQAVACEPVRGRLRWITFCIHVMLIDKADYASAVPA